MVCISIRLIIRTVELEVDHGQTSVSEVEHMEGFESKSEKFA